MCVHIYIYICLLKGWRWHPLYLQKVKVAPHALKKVVVTPSSILPIYLWGPLSTHIGIGFMMRCFLYPSTYLSMGGLQHSSKHGLHDGTLHSSIYLSIYLPTHLSIYLSYVGGVTPPLKKVMVTPSCSLSEEVHTILQRAVNIHIYICTCVYIYICI